MLSPEWQDYVNKMTELEKAVKLTAYWTKETAELAQEASQQALLTTYFVKEHIKEVNYEKQ